MLGYSPFPCFSSNLEDNLTTLFAFLESFSEYESNRLLVFWILWAVWIVGVLDSLGSMKVKK